MSLLRNRPNLLSRIHLPPGSLINHPLFLKKLIFWIFFRKKEHTHISVLSRKVLLEKYSIVFWWMIELISSNEYLIIVTFYNSGYSKKSRLSELAATISSNFEKAPKWIISQDKSFFNLKIITIF